MSVMFLNNNRDSLLYSILDIEGGRYELVLLAKVFRRSRDVQTRATKTLGEILLSHQTTTT